MAEIAAAAVRLARGDKPRDIAVEPTPAVPPVEDGMSACSSMQAAGAVCGPPISSARSPSRTSNPSSPDEGLAGEGGDAAEVTQLTLSGVARPHPFSEGAARRCLESYELQR